MPENDVPTAAAAASDTPFRSTIEQSSVGLFRLGKTQCFEAVNGAWLALHGYASAGQIIGKSFTTVLVEDEVGAATEFVSQAFAGRELPAVEFRRKRVDGSIGYQTVSLHPVWQAGAVVAVEGYLIDTTSLRQATAE